MSPERIGAKLAKQKRQAKEQRQRDKAEQAAKHFRPKKSERGKLVMITGAGNRNPQARGKRGLLVYVSKTGKKTVVKQYGPSPYKTRKITQLQPKLNSRLKKPIKEFQLARRQLISKNVAQLRGKGKVATGGAYDFTDKASDKIAKSLKKTIERQASHRSFYIDGMALIKVEGKLQTVPFGLPIDKPDHIAIKIEGMQNFVRRKFYAFMAADLAKLGFVTAGSSNNIRRLPQNRGKERSEWKNRNGENWKGSNLQTVHLQSIEWKIEQLER